MLGSLLYLQMRRTIYIGKAETMWFPKVFNEGHSLTGLQNHPSICENKVIIFVKLLKSVVDFST